MGLNVSVTRRAPGPGRTQLNSYRRLLSVMDGIPVGVCQWMGLEFGSTMIGVRKIPVVRLARKTRIPSRIRFRIGPGSAGKPGSSI